MQIDNLGEFMQNPVAGSLMWRVDPRTDDIIGTCKECGAELRLPNAMPGEVMQVTFEHEDECPWMREVDENTESRARELARKVADILDDEPDLELVLSALAFVTGVLCGAVAQERASSVRDVAKRFEDELRDKVESISRAMSEARTVNEAA